MITLIKRPYISKCLVKNLEIRPPAGAFSMWSSSLPTKLQKSSSFKAKSGPSKISHVDIFVSNDDQQSNESIRKKVDEESQLLPPSLEVEWRLPPKKTKRNGSNKLIEMDQGKFNVA